MEDTDKKYNTRQKRNASKAEDKPSKRRRVDYSSDSDDDDLSDDSFIVGDDEPVEYSESEETEETGESVSQNSDPDYEDDDDEQMQIKGIQINFVMNDREDEESIRPKNKKKTKSDERLELFFSNNEIPENIKELFYEKYNQFMSMNKHASEYFKLKKWLDDFLKIPFGHYVQFPSTGNMHMDSNFLREAQTTLDTKLYGQSRAKDELMEILTKWIINPDSRGQVIGLQGSPGVGKTELAKNCIAPVMQRPFQYISLGGLTDGSYFDGHSYTYEGATHGRLAQMLMDAGCMNPIIFMDELDKISESRVGQEIVGKLIHLTDPTQNDMIMDKYFTGVPFDFSKALIIFSFNDPNLIDRVLLNRIRIIKMDDFDTNDKMNIANNYLLPKICEENRINIKFSDVVLKHIIHKNNEPGVRGLKSDLENIIMKLNVIRMLPEKQPTIHVFNNMIFSMDMYHKLYKSYPSDISEISRLMMYV